MKRLLVLAISSAALSWFLISQTVVARPYHNPGVRRPIYHNPYIYAPYDCDTFGPDLYTNIRATGTVQLPMLGPIDPRAYTNYRCSPFIGRGTYLPPAPQDPRTTTAPSSRQPSSGRSTGMAQCWNYAAKPTACSNAPGCFWDSYLSQCRPYRF